MISTALAGSKSDTKAINNSLEFIWLELTNQCNLKCTHCYAGSGPDAGKDDVLTRADYETLIKDASLLGCKKVQFIGGEPTLNPDLKHLIQYASEHGYEYIEVYTNLVSINDVLIDCYRKYNVQVATSVYAEIADIHDSVTQTKGSFNRTIRNIETLLRNNISVRASIIGMEQNSDNIDSTIAMLEGIGVTNIGVDYVRGIGRGNGENEHSAMSELCGNCSGNILCVGPDGRVAPCIMSKEWFVGSVLETSLQEISSSAKLSATRKQISEATGKGPKNSEINMGSCTPDRPDGCAPEKQPCTPCSPNGHCGPNACQPTRRPR